MSTKQARRDADLIMQLIRHQVFCPDGATVGPCASGCGKSARGCSVCAACLVEELRALLPEAGWWPVSYWHLCIEQRAIEQKIMEIAGGGDDGR